MNRKRGAWGIVMACALTVGVGAFATTAFAVDEQYSYEPTVQGNSAYSGNLVDEADGYGVEGNEYTNSISQQNAEEVAATKALGTTIGSASDDASPVRVTNNTGKTIKELALRTSNQTAYGLNQLSASLNQGDAACWFYAYNYQEQSYTNSTGITIQEPVNTCLKVTFSDGTTGEFHNINMNAVRTIELCYSPDYSVYYVQRTTITNHTPDPNLYYETNLASYTGGEAEFNYHVDSGGRMGALAITASRGGGWDVGHDPLQEITDYKVELPLYGTPYGSYTKGLYDALHWNSDSLTWREWGGDL